MDDEPHPVGCFFIGAALMFSVLSFFVTFDCKWHRQAIEHGAAQYNPVTGKFEWKEKDVRPD